MPRMTHGAKTLIAQVSQQKKNTKHETVGDPDGLNVYRTIKFNKATSSWLAPLLDEIADPRIADLNVTDAGFLHVTFVAGPQADRRDPFPLDAAAEVLSG